VDGERVHVGAQADRAVGLADLEAADDARLGEPAMDLDAVGRELAGDAVGGQRLLVAELGMGVDVAPDARELGVVALMRSTTGMASSSGARARTRGYTSAPRCREPAAGERRPPSTAKGGRAAFLAFSSRGLYGLTPPSAYRI
jgi:hypothetical protein